MKKKLLILIAAFFASFLFGQTALAEEGTTGAQISPVSNTILLEAGTTNEYTFEVKNPNSEGSMTYEIYVTPYSFTYSEEDDEYHLGFSAENNYTQITRWISFKDDSGETVSKLTVTLAAGESKEITYIIATPESIPNGGQYAVIFAQTVNNSANTSGIKTSARTGLLIYGRSTGETIRSITIDEISIPNSFMMGGNISANAKVTNTGNTDATVTSTLKVQGIFGNSYYENEKKTSVIPEVSLKINDEWENGPFFGLFKVSWTISANDNTETVTNVTLIMPLSVLIGVIILLTIVIIWIIIMVKKRKERRSRKLI